MRFRGFVAGISAFVRGHGFALLTTICVAVITASALWAGQLPEPVSSATPPAYHLPASLSLEQGLDSVTASPLPTAQPLVWQRPVNGGYTLQAYCDDVMHLTDLPGLWTVHTAADLSAEGGSAVTCMADGTVLGSGSDGISGTWISISHADGYVSVYRSLSLLGAFQPGDRVRAGHVIGYAGNSYPAERSLGDHVHIEILHDGIPVDPETFLP